MCMHEGRIPKDERMGLIVPIWKRTGDVHDPGKYRGITLLSQVLKLLERVLDARIRRRVEGDFGEEQQGFRKGRGIADGMYVPRQMVEKRLEVQSSMALGFVHVRDGLHLSGKGAAVFAEGLSGAVASGLGKVRYLN